MSYANAKDIFPDDILEIIQEYIDGEYIYIPKKEENKKLWGDYTKSKEILSKRNMKIYQDYLAGFSTKDLASHYYLSQKTIQRIILQKRKK